MTETTALAPSRLSLLERRLSNLTWFIVLLLSLRGIYEFYGMKEKGLLEQALVYVTQPFVQIFQFGFIENLNIPALPVLLAAVSLLLASKWVRLYIYRTDLRFARMRRLVYTQAVSAVPGK